jgi:outer membrane protein OmpA-like peptidoglycan-associated protein
MNPARSYRRCAIAASLAACVPALVLPKRSAADTPELHAEAGLAHAVGDPQGREFGFGGGASVAGELTFRRVLGVQAEVGLLGLSDGERPSSPTIAAHGAGVEWSAMAGVRLHPFGQRRVAGLWLDANVGAAVTGTLLRPTFDAHLGYDVRVGRGRFDLGPFVGYEQIVQPDDTLRPEDAHIVLAGLHAALGAPRPRTLWRRADRDGDGIYDDADACPDVPGIATNDVLTNGCPETDRDHDLVLDVDDACPDVPGIRTTDPKTNGCPRGDRDGDLVYDDEDACPDVAGRRTDDPKTNGCPRLDRDGDLVFDDEDACPDVPGLRTSDPKTNGCPAASDDVHLEGAKLVLGDIIHFETDSPRIPHASWPICRKLAEFIDKNPDVLELDIEGHADETGTNEHNFFLSRMRALAVKRLLVQFGVDPVRMTTHAYGETRPRVSGHAEEQLRQNRRVEFTVTRARSRADEGRATALVAADKDGSVHETTERTGGTR